MTRVCSSDNRWLPAFFLLALGGCSSSDDQTDAGMSPVATAGTSATGAAGSATGVAGATSGTTGAAGAATGAAGSRSGAAGRSAGASGSTSGAAGAAGTASGAAGAAGASGGAAGAAGAVAGAGGTTAAGAGGASGAPAPSGMRMPASARMLPIVMESGGAEPWFNVYRPMDLAAIGEPLPVIVWANGGCFRSDFTWAPLFNRWAAGGFIVLALTESPTEGALVQTTVEHQGQLIDWAFARNDESAGPYAGKIDKERVIAAGNSCGGITALGLAAEDERVAAVFVLSGSSNIGSPNRRVVDAITQPVGFVVGGSEDIAGANATGDYEAFGMGVPAMIVSRSSGDHMTVSTDTMILLKVAEIALNWMDLAVYGTKEALDALKSPTVCAMCPAGEWTLKSKNIETLVK